MKTVIAIDSFKGSLSSFEAGSAVAEGIQAVFPGSENIIIPVADGGEGTVGALCACTDGEKINIQVSGPLGKPVCAEYGIIQSSGTAVIEIAAAAGITLINEKERNPLNTTTAGVGEMISDAIKRGCRRFIIGLGGSATNDCGIGMLQVLGFGLLDENGDSVPYGARGVSQVHTITTDNINPFLSECEFFVACDVNNPLCGDNGCSAVYGPQKGADSQMVCDMDKWLSDYAGRVKNIFSDADENYPGVGAAGGLGYAFKTFLNGKLERGIDIVLRTINFDAIVKDADVVITGEGRLDRQTAMGKAPGGIAEAAKRHNKKVIAFSGSATPDAVEVNQHGIDAFFPILRTVCTLEEAMDSSNAYQNMKSTTEQVFRLMKRCLNE